MCKHGCDIPVSVIVDARVAAEGRTIRKDMPIDSCIAELVHQLDTHGVRMLGSCCGHSDIYEGSILLADGHTLRLYPSLPYPDDDAGRSDWRRRYGIELRDVADRTPTPTDGA